MQTLFRALSATSPKKWMASVNRSISLDHSQHLLGEKKGRACSAACPFQAPHPFSVDGVLLSKGQPHSFLFPASCFRHTTKELQCLQSLVHANPVTTSPYSIAHDAHLNQASANRTTPTPYNQSRWLSAMPTQAAPVHPTVTTQLYAMPTMLCSKKQGKLFGV